MGWFLSPTFLLILVCVYDAWVFSLQNCKDGEMFCKVIRGCTTKKKCDVALADLEQKKKDCVAKSLIFCEALKNCTTAEKCAEGVPTSQRPSQPRHNQCQNGEMFCKATGGCTTQEKCFGPTLRPSGTPPSCETGQIFCPMNKSCTSKEMCDKACPDGQMFCKVIRGCTTKQKCDAALADLEQKKKDCEKKSLIYCPLYKNCSAPKNCREGSWDDIHPYCGDDQIFCPMNKSCTTKEMCDKACPDGQIFCKVIRGCTTKQKCDAELADLEQKKKDCEKKSLIYCPLYKNCSAPKNCREGSWDDIRPYCGDDQIFCPMNKSCTTKEMCDKACPDGQIFCKVIRGCTTKQKCDAALADLEQKKKDCEKKNLIYCLLYKNCSAPKNCREVPWYDIRPDCGDDQKRCKDKCIEIKEKCDCGENMTYCDSKERCMPKWKLKDRFECPPVCRGKAERYCPFSEKCIGRDELCKCPDDKPVACGVLKTCINSTETCPCPKDHTFCKNIWGCLPKGEKCPLCEKGEKYCLFRDRCISGEKDCGCPADTKFCPFRRDPKMPACANITVDEDACDCSDTKKKCLTQMRCIDKDETCACPEGQEYCPRNGECAAGGCRKDDCSEDEIFCKATGECTTREKCPGPPTLRPSGPPPNCKKGEIFCKALRVCTTAKKCANEGPLTRQPSLSSDPCPKGEASCVPKSSKRPPISKKPLPISRKPLPISIKPLPISRKPLPISIKPLPISEKPLPISKKPPKDKNNYFFLGTIHGNIAEEHNRGFVLGERLKFKEALFEGTLGNVDGRWQMKKSTVGSRAKATWSSVKKGVKISLRDSIRFLPANFSVHGFEGVEVKINDQSKYFGIIILPCIVPKLQVKKELSATEEELLKFNFDDVFSVTRKPLKNLVSNLVDEYNEFVPNKTLDEYAKMLKASSVGSNLGIMVMLNSKHMLMEQKEELDKDGFSDKRLLPIFPKRFDVGSKLAFRPAKDETGIVKIIVFPVDLPPESKEFKNSCGVGKGVELIINIANVNDRPMPRPIDPRNPKKLRIIVDAPPLPHKLENDLANEGFPVGKFAGKAGTDADGDSLGIAVVKGGRSEIGQWQYRDKNDVWQNIQMAVNVNNKGTIEGDQAELLFLTPARKIRFKPAKNNSVWREREALRTMLRFLLWDQSDGLESGLHNISWKGSSSLSSQLLTTFMKIKGCDGRPGSGLTENECGECGKKTCVKCDGRTDSDAVWNECKICVLGSTGKNISAGKDCRGICKGSFIMHKKCKKCVSKGKQVTDCSGTCLGTKRMQRCKVCSHDKKAGEDACGVCGGDNSTCVGCDNVPNSKKKWDRCNNCLDPESPQFNKGCIKLGAISPKSHETGKKIVYKIKASGFSESGATCELRLGDVRVPLQVSVKSLQLTAEKVDKPGVYDLVCTISGKEYALQKAVTVLREKIIVSRVDPREVDVDSEEIKQVTITGQGFMDSQALSCIYSDGSGRKHESLPAIFVSPTECKCNVSRKQSRKIKISITFDRNEGISKSYVEVIVQDEAVNIMRYTLNNRAKTISIIFEREVKNIRGCEKIFNEATMKKLKDLAGKRKISCNFKKANELYIRIPGAAIDEDLRLVFKNDVIKAGKGFSRPSGELTVTVKAPPKEIPTAVITGPEEVGSSHGIRITAKNSKNTGKRYNCSWQFSIEGVDDESSLSSEVKADLRSLRVLFKDRCMFKISKTNVLAGYTYVLTLVVSNGQVSSPEAQHSIRRSNKEIPSVRFITKATVFDMRRAKFRIKVVAKIPEGIKDSKLQYSWSCDPMVELLISNKPELILLSRDLDCGVQYRCSISVYPDSNPDLQVELTYNITTKASDLVYTIRGGDRTVPSGGDFKLKARKISKPECVGKLRYIFSCVDDDDMPCLVKTKDGKYELMNDTDRDTLNMKANLFESNKTYTFKLAVFGGTYKSESSVKVTIAPGTPPTVTIKKPKDGKKPIVIVFIKSSSNSPISFNCEGVVESGYGFIDFQDKSKVRGNSRGENMVFRRRRLKLALKDLAPGVTYKIRCRAYHIDAPDEVGESTSLIDTPSPPQGGLLTAEPAEGISSETSFSIVAEEFISNSSISYSFYTENKKGERMLLVSNTEASVEFQMPPGEDNDDYDLIIVVVASNEFGKSESRTNIKSRPKQLNTSDFESFEETMTNYENEGDKTALVVFALSVASTAKGQEKVKDKVNELQENTAQVLVVLLAEKRKEGTADVKVLFALARNTKPQNEDTKKALADEVSGAVEETVSKTVKRRDDFEKTGGKSRRRRAVEEESGDDDDDDAGMSIDEIEDTLATFENLIDTSVVNNNTENFLQSVDSLLINMCKDLPLGDTSVALSNIAILKTDMNYLDNADGTFINMSCTNCSMLNQSALVKFGSEIKQMYNEWNCSGTDELCNGLCAAMVQYPHDFITAVKSPVRMSDVLFLELKNPETQDFIPVNISQPILFQVPLHAGFSESSGHKCVIWSESEDQWSTSGCQRTRSFTKDGVVFVECSCTKLGYITIHESDEQFITTTKKPTTQQPNTTQAPTSQPTNGNRVTAANERRVAKVEFKFDADYKVVVRDDETKQKLLNVIEDELADTMTVDRSMILNVTITPGSILVKFILLAPEKNPDIGMNYSLTKLQFAVNDGKFTIFFNNQQLTAENGTMKYVRTTMAGVTPDETSAKTKSEEVESNLVVILVVVFCVLLIVVIIGVLLFRRHLSQQTKVSHGNIQQDVAMTAQNENYQGSVDKTPGNAAPLEARLSSGSSGQASPRQTAELPHVD
ncbi:uncharacterized protein LOC114516639 [Dendronephthya gigantea]|uniref:uncharacterized protein LOC114516639 n=1 Tax=Dendronephthya gigantea TaxID=151771 RepID=UPI00106A2CA6|nr:uncharacterized protein LOC114516639 [Dendronephthya gigantea]